MPLEACSQYAGSGIDPLPQADQFPVDLGPGGLALLQGAGLALATGPGRELPDHCFGLGGVGLPCSKVVCAGLEAGPAGIKGRSGLAGKMRLDGCAGACRHEHDDGGQAGKAYEGR